METTSKEETIHETSFQNFFTGSVPRNYDTYMGPILFTPYAIDLAERMRLNSSVNVLELAAGTGRVTKEIIARINDDLSIIATDISMDMMEVAQETINADNLKWAIADMSNLPYEDEHFDIIICGFGLMFVPDKLKALTEMYRVLKTGGQLLLNTWGKMEENSIWHIGFKTLTSFLGDMPFPKDAGPFALTDKEAVVSMMHQAGFINSKATEVRKTSTVATADEAATAFLMTAPQLAKNPSIVPQIHEALEKELAQTLGDHPLHAPLLALVFEAIKN